MSADPVAQLIAFLESAALYVTQIGLGLLSVPFTWTEQLFAVYVGTFVLLAGFSYRVWYRRRDPGLRDFFRWLFPKRIYLHPSARVDYAIYVINTVLAPLTALFGITLQTWISISLASGLTSMNGGAALSSGDWTTLIWAVFILGHTLAADLSVYLIHRLHHATPFLWPIHALHHSAEVLTPFTLFRKHPLWNLSANLLSKALTGVFGGLFIFFYFGSPSFEVLFGINTIYVAYNFCGANLRHSHVWLSWGKPLSYLFISPAMHQIHHDPTRMRRNYGEIFALWDWWFGTLYIPDGREKFDVGLGETNPHNTIWRAYWRPLADSAAALTRLARR